MSAAQLMRCGLALLVALGITGALFLFMRALVGGPELPAPARAPSRVAVRLPAVEEAGGPTRRELPERRPIPVAPTNPSLRSEIEAGALAVGEAPSAASAHEGWRLGLDAQPVRLVELEPDYPLSAHRLAKEGWVLLEFDVSVEGKTERIRVLEAQPPGFFEREAVSTLAQWRYRPRFVDGQPRRTRNLRIRMTFQLD